MDGGQSQEAGKLDLEGGPKWVNREEGILKITSLRPSG